MEQKLVNNLILDASVDGGVFYTRALSNEGRTALGRWVVRDNFAMPAGYWYGPPSAGTRVLAGGPVLDIGYSE